MLNLQEIFDKGVWGILEQGEPAYSVKNNMCYYRRPNNTKCFIGHLIKDKYYNEDFEGNDSGDLYVIRAVILSIGYSVKDVEDLSDYEENFLSECQTILECFGKK